MRGGLPSRCGPVAAHELVVAADAAGGDDHGLRVELELADRVARARLPARARALGASTSPRTPSTAPPRDRQLVDLVAEAQLDEPARDRLAHAALERLDDARAGAPGDVEARDRVAVAGREVAAALGPADVRARSARPARAATRASRRRRSRRRPRPSGAASRPPARSKPAVPSQSCQRELARVLDAQPPLLGAVDEEQAAERPERLAAERRLRLLVDEDHPAAGVGQLGGGDEAGEARRRRR